ncbi:hypothetical protein [Streptomyces sp. NPDC058374]|uniref:hypothetical protein n=1 Tax=unclassified Streptomyces TaxID=2593676 RepID=UPI0036647789
MAFGADELRVLRRALAIALQPSTADDEDVSSCLRLAHSVDEAVHESARLRAFLLADLARYRAALPGTVAGYLPLLEEALGAGYQPVPDDLAALRALRGNEVAADLLARCRVLAERAVRAKLAGRPVPAEAARATVPASRTRLHALPGGDAAERPAGPGPDRRPGTPDPERERPVPTPAEVFPPKRKPAPPAEPPRKLAAG